MGRRVFRHPQELGALWSVTVTWEDKCHHSKDLPPTPSFSHCFIYWAWHHTLSVECPFGSWSHLFWLCPLTTPCAPRPPHWWGGVRKVFDTVQILLGNIENIPVLPSSASSTNPKQSLILATARNVDSIPAKTSTASVGNGLLSRLFQNAVLRC